MGLADLILGSQNPFAQFVASNKNTIHGLGAGLASGQNFSQGLSNAAQQGLAGNAPDDAYAVAQKAEADRQAAIQQQSALRQKYAAFFQQQNQPVYAQFVADGVMDPGQAYGDWQKSVSPNADPTSTVAGRTQLAQQYQLPPDDAKAFVLTGKLPDARQNPRAGVGQPIAFKNKKTGELVYIQPETVGPGVNTMTGQPLDSPDDYMPAPYDLAALKTGGSGDSSNAVAARNSLPGVEQAYAITKKAISDLTTDASVKAGQSENFGNVLGVPQQMLPILPKTNRANFQNVIDQLSGQAFLNIRQALKGAGQVTDFEGAKGEDAISRMKNAASRGDEAAFNAAVQDFNTALDNGIALLRKQAAGGYAAGNVPGLQGGAPQGAGADPVAAADALLKSGKY